MRRDGLCPARTWGGHGYEIAASEVSGAEREEEKEREDVVSLAEEE